MVVVFNCFLLNRFFPLLHFFGLQKRVHFMALTCAESAGANFLTILNGLSFVFVFVCGQRIPSRQDVFSFDTLKYGRAFLLLAVEKSRCLESFLPTFFSNRWQEVARWHVFDLKFG